MHNRLKSEGNRIVRTIEKVVVVSEISESFLDLTKELMANYKLIISSIIN